MPVRHVPKKFRVQGGLPVSPAIRPHNMEAFVYIPLDIAQIREDAKSELLNGQTLTATPTPQTLTIPSMTVKHYRKTQYQYATSYNGVDMSAYTVQSTPTTVFSKQFLSVTYNTTTIAANSGNTIYGTYEKLKEQLDTYMGLSWGLRTMISCPTSGGIQVYTVLSLTDTTGSSGMSSTSAQTMYPSAYSTSKVLPVTFKINFI